MKIIACYSNTKMRNCQAGFLKTVIPFSTDIEKMGVHRAPALTYARCGSPAYAYQALWTELEKKL